MEKSLECEAKALINEEDYQTIINQCHVSKTYTQINHYLDTNNYFKDHHQALRIRQKNNLNELTLKTKTPTGNIEQTIKLTDDIVNQILLTKTLPDQLKEQLQLKVDSFDHIKTITTTRSVIPFNGVNIELDKSTFNQTIDYELEIEAQNLTTAQQLLTMFCEQHNINPQPSMPKIARYDLYNKGTTK